MYLNRPLHWEKTHTHEGAVATYIPELGKVDGSQLGVSVFCRNGKRISVGDTKVRFSIQSISKIITLAVALEICGFDQVFKKVGMEPTGDPFNSLMKLENTDSSPYNPMINAGAIVVASCLASEISFDTMLDTIRALCMDPDINLDKKGLSLGNVSYFPQPGNRLSAGEQGVHRKE